MGKEDDIQKQPNPDIESKQKKLTIKIDSALLLLGVWDKQIASGRKKKDSLIDFQKRMEIASGVLRQIDIIAGNWSQMQSSPIDNFLRQTWAKRNMEFFSRMGIVEPKIDAPDPYVRYFPSLTGTSSLDVSIICLEDGQDNSRLREVNLGTISKEGNINFGVLKRERVRMLHVDQRLINKTEGMLCQKINLSQDSIDKEED